MNARLKTLDFTLEPADNLRLASLCGQFDEHLRQIERRLGVEINNRGNAFRVIGDQPNVEAAKPMVYTTTIFLLIIVVLLNLTAIIVRNKLREKYKTGAF